MVAETFSYQGRITVDNIGGFIMKYFTRFSAVIALFFVLSAFTPNTVSPVEGLWIGEFTSVDHSVSFKVHFWQDHDGLKGNIYLSDGGSRELPLSWVMVESTSVHFELVQNSGTLVFDGILKDGKISGDLLCSNLRGKFQLTPERLVSL
ncbi:MAG TPA: hypothetical protein VI758_13560 [Bacteroidota bacterium]